MSKTIGSLIAKIGRFITLPMNANRRMNALCLASEKLAQHYAMAVPNGNLKFHSTTARSLHDAHSIMHGEPEMIRWLDSLHEDAVLWDIGANIGVYSLYAAFVRNISVLAFEPGAANHAALCKNIELNNLDKIIQPFCLAFAEQTSIDTLFLSNSGAGHSTHSFGQEFEKAEHQQSVTGYSVDDFCKIFSPKLPTYIKLDVDGIEMNIIKGAEITLKDHVQSIIVEFEEEETSASNQMIASQLQDYGFHERKSDEISLRNSIFDK